MQQKSHPFQVAHNVWNGLVPTLALPRSGFRGRSIPSEPLSLVSQAPPGLYSALLGV